MISPGDHQAPESVNSEYAMASNSRKGRSRPTMKDIAREAGVSVMTVSLALRDQSRVSKATKVRIQRIADTMGYRPDPALSSLVAYRSSLRSPAFSGVIGYLNAYPDREHYRNHFLHRDYFEAALQHAGRSGYEMEAFWLGDPDMGESRLRQILHTRNISGLLVGPLPWEHATLDEKWLEFPAVAFGYSLNLPFCDRVGTSHFQSTTECMRKLGEMGYQRIGYFDTPDQEERTRGRWLGGVTSFQLRFLPAANRVRPFIGPAGGKKCLSWLRSVKPDVVLAGSSHIVDLLLDQGYRVPQDIGVAFPSYREKFPDFTFLREDTERIGEVAVDHLIRKIHTGPDSFNRRPINLMVDGSWSEGISTRRICS